VAYTAGTLTVNLWLASELTAHLEIALEGASAAVIDEAPPDNLLRKCRTFSGIPGAMWVAAADAATLEGIEQPLVGMAQSFSTLLGREISCQSCEDQSALQAPINWTRFEPGSFYIGADADLLKAISKDDPARETSKTFDLLMDVELPVSVSFGRAEVALKDVLKLTTGSIVELNRAIGDPVEVIVNNCVIARGEVVVVEGNFGVRVHQVISRQERLRTLH